MLSNHLLFNHLFFFFAPTWSYIKKFQEVHSVWAGTLQPSTLNSICNITTNPLGGRHTLNLVALSLFVTKFNKTLNIEAYIMQ